MQDAAKELGISESHARRLGREGQLPTIRLGHRVLVPRWKLDDLLGTTTTDNEPADNGAAGSAHPVCPWRRKTRVN